MPELLIMNCPYCGSSDVHEIERKAESTGHEGEMAVICCLSCNEECAITRDLQSVAELEWECPKCHSDECASSPELPKCSFLD